MTAGRLRLGDAATYAVLLVVLVAVAYPAFWMVASSLRDRFEILADPFGLPTAPSLDNYRAAWVGAGLGRNVLNSLIVTVPAVLLVLAVSAAAGYAFARLRFPGRRPLFLVLLVGIMVPPQAIAVPLFLLVSRLDLLNSFVGLILVYGSWSPVGIFILTTFFRAVPREIEESARVDGAGPLTVFARIMLPLATPALVTVAVFYFVWIYNDFLFPLLLLQEQGLATVPLALSQFRGQYTVDYGSQTAALSIAVVVPVVFYLLFQDRIVRGLTAGAVKG